MKTILVAVDLSDVTQPLLSTAAALAKAMQSSVYLVHVAAPEPTFVTYEPGPDHERQFRAQQLRVEHRDLQKLAEDMEKSGVEAEPLMVSGPTVLKLLEEADRLKADLIVIGSHGHGALYHLLVGSVTDGVIRKAKCPVMVVPSRK
ncbi:MAG: universal stress protein [Phycisphaeraceae bacterium]